MTRDDVQAGLNEIIQFTFDDDDNLVLLPAGAHHPLRDWDSLSLVSIIIEIEARFGIRFRSGELDALKTLGDLLALIDEKSDGRSAAS